MKRENKICTRPSLEHRSGTRAHSLQQCADFGILGLFVGHPLDTIKVRQQTFKEKGLFKVIVSTYKYDGIKGFYRGLLFPLLAAGSYNSIFFGTFGNILRALQKDNIQHNRKFCCEEGAVEGSWHLHVGIAGGIAGATTVMFGSPVELIKTQLQVITDSKKQNSRDIITGPFSCAKAIYKIGGIRALYKGLTPLLLRDIPGFSIYVLAYEHILCMLQGKMKQHQKISIQYDIIAGGCAGILSWMLLMPVDVVKSRLQGDNLRNPVYKGMIDCFIKSYKQEGLSVFMQGFWVCAIRAFPANAVTFVVYEKSLSACEIVATKFFGD